MMKKRSVFKKILSIILIAAMMDVSPFSMSALSVSASTTSGTEDDITLTANNMPDAEVALSVGDTKIDYSTFNDDLATALESMGVSKDKVTFASVDATASAAQKTFDWWSYDHSTSRNVSGNNYIEAVGSQTENAFNSKSRHIATNTDGTTLNFFGYGTSGYKDFNFLPNSQATKKVIQFALDERADGSTASYDALDGFGFLINSSITGSYSSTQVINGYLLFFQYSTSPCKGTSIKLLKLNNVNAYNLHHMMADKAFDSMSADTGVSTVATATTGYGDYRYRKIKIQVMPDSIKLWYNGSSSNNSSLTFADDNVSNLVQWKTSAGSTITEYPLEQAYDGDTFRGGYGPLISYRSHNCGTTTNVRLTNLSMVADYVRSTTEVVREPNWDDSKVSFLVNLNEAKIEDFSDAYSTAEIVNRLEDDNITYIGWCGQKNVADSQIFVDNLAEGSALVNMDDTEQFTSSPYTKESYRLQISAIAKAIVKKLTKQTGTDNIYTYLNTDTFSFTSNALLDDGKWSVGYSTESFADASTDTNISTYQNLANASFSNCGYYEVYYNGDTTAPKARIRVHQAPVPKFTSNISATGITVENKSYDMEFCEDTNLATGSKNDGIENSVFEYKNLAASGSEWLTSAPTSVNTTDTWLVRLTVTDADGASENTVQQLSLNSTDAAPYGTFRLSANQYIKGIDETVDIIDQSYALDGATDFTVKYTLKNSSDTTLWTSTTTSGANYFAPGMTYQYSLSGLLVGTYTLSMNATKGTKTCETIKRTFKVVQGYKVTYDAGEGTGAPSTQYKVAGTALNLSNIAPTRTGYNFISWSGNDGEEYEAGASYNTDAALALTAKWSAAKYRATFNGTNVEEKSGFGDQKATYQSEWKGQIQASMGYYLPKSIGKIQSGSETLSEGEYTYDSTTGEITIPGENVFGMITVTASSNRSIFSTLEIRKGSKTGELVVDLLNQESRDSDWKLSQEADYYLCASVKRHANLDYLQIRYGSEDGTANGVTFANPPGGGYTAGAISDDYFSKLMQYQDFAGAKYGSTTAALGLKDGKLTYQIKDDINEDNAVAFAIGFVINDSMYDATGKISDAIGVSVGTYDSESKTFTDRSNQTIDLKVAAKNEFSCGVTTSNSSTELDGIGNTLYFYALGNRSSEKQAAALFDKYSVDITYPKGSELSAGYGTTMTKANATYGKISISEPEDAETDLSGVAMQKVTLTIDKGLKALGSTISIYYRLAFPESATENTFRAGGKYTLTLSDAKLSMNDNTIPVTITNPKTTYTLTEGGADATSMSAMNRTVYNQTIAKENAGYLVPMGSVLLKNNNGGSTTPFEKTYEAKFNTSNTAAKITLITVPIGADKTPSVTVWGDKAGTETEGYTLTSDEVEKMGNNGTLKNSQFLMIYAKDLGMTNITKVKADIGKLKAAYTSSSWTAGWTSGYNAAGAFGYFTEGTPGIQVINEVSVYNTKPEERNKKNGELAATTTATATDVCRFGMSAGTIRITDGKNKTTNLASDSAVAAGDTATISGTLYPYSIVGAVYKKTGSVTEYASTMMVDNPVFYLTLPAGLSPDRTKISFQRLTYSSQSKLLSTSSNLSYTLGEGVQKGDVTIYKLTFDEDQSFGYLDESGQYSYLSYKFGFKTEKTLATQRYRLNDLVTFTTENKAKALPYANVNNASIVSTRADKYQLNDGNDVCGIAKDKDSVPVGFGVQQQSDISVAAQMCVTEIDGDEVAASEQIWRTYSSTNPNSMAIIGKNSKGTVKLNITNTSVNKGDDLSIVLPIPKKDQDFGSLFMDEKQGFDLSMSINSSNAELVSSDKFDVKYIKIHTGEDGTKKYNSTAAFFGEDGTEKNYDIVENKEDANALLIVSDSLEKGQYSLYFDFGVENGTVGSTNVWNSAYNYQIGTENRQKIGDDLGSSVAGSSVTGSVFNDSNRNGIKDEGEEGVAGIEVSAIEADGRTQTTTTNEDGVYNYVFNTVRETPVTLKFTAAADADVRFNIGAKDAVMGSVVSTVTPSADGRSASQVIYVSGDVSVNAAMGSFVSVLYNANGASGFLPARQDYAAGEMAVVAVKPDNLLKKGQKFVGWCTKSTQDDTSTLYQPGATFLMGEEDVELYAIWQTNSYNVTFNYRGATSDNEESSRTILYGKKYGTTYKNDVTESKSLPAPKRSGYTFKGWTNGAASTSANVNDNTYFNAGANTILYAIWTPKSSYKVSYESNGGTQVAEKTGVSWEGTLLPEDSPSKEGYEFTGWYLDGSKVSAYATYSELASDDSQEEITLMAQWNAKSGYTVHYDGNGAKEVFYDKTGFKWNDTGVLPLDNPTQKGYAFLGWKVFDGENVTGNYVTAQDEIGGLLGKDTVLAVTLQAQWEKIEDNVVKYVTNGGDIYQDRNGVKSEDANLLPSQNPNRKGYIFDGWYAGETKVTNESTYGDLTTEEVLTIEAKWTAKQYKVSYQTDAQSIADKENVKWTDKDLLPNETLTKNGYTFSGWYYNSSKVTKDQSISDISSEDFEDGIVTLTAKWTGKNYTIIYNTDGGSYLSPKSNQKFTNANLLADVTPTKRGYAFAGWYAGVSDDSEGTKVEDTTTLEALSAYCEGQYLTLKAKWTTKQSFIVSYDTNGGTSITSKENVGWNDAVLPLEQTSRVGYTLTGWKVGRTTIDDNTTFGSLTTNDAEGASITLVAQWEKKRGFTVCYDTGCEVDIPNKENIAWSDCYLLPGDVMQIPGFAFAGWGIEGDLGNVTKVNNLTSFETMAGGDETKESVTLTAQWEVKNNYMISYDTQGGGSIEDKNGISWSDSSLLPTEIPVKEGYTFKGWTYESDTGATTYVNKATDYAAIANNEEPEDGRVTLRAEWEAKKYTIYYDLDDDGIADDEIAPLTGIHFTESGLTTDFTPELSGYKFNNWYCGNELISETTKLCDILENDSQESIVLTADWTAKKYKVVYETGSGTKLSAKENKTFSDDNLLPEKASVETGYNLQGWYAGDEEKLVENETTLSQLKDFVKEGEIVLTAKWIPKDAFVVSYDSKGGAAVDEKTDVKWTDSGFDEVPIKRIGYKLNGWLLNGEPITSATTFEQMAESDGQGTEVTLDADWVEREYDIQYDTACDTEISDGKGKYTDANLLPDETLQKTGYIFKGWYANNEILSQTTSIQSILGSEADEVSNVVLTAKWQAIEAEKPELAVEGGASVVYGYAQEEAGSITASVVNSDKDTYDYEFQWYQKNKASSDEKVAIPDAKQAVYQLPEGIAAGEYTYSCKVTAKRKDNSETATEDSDEITLIVTKKPLTVTPKDTDIIYGDQAKCDGINYAGFVGEDSVDDIKGEVTYSYNYDTNQKVGTYKITPDISALQADNYSFTAKEGVLKVQKRPIVLKWSEDSFVYDGTVKTVLAKIENVVNDDDVQIDQYSGNTERSIGDYKASAESLKGDKADNYTLEQAENVSHAWSITKAPAEPTKPPVQAEPTQEPAKEPVIDNPAADSQQNADNSEADQLKIMELMKMRAEMTNKINAKVKVSQVGSKIKMRWGKIKQAEGYEVYVQYCGRGFKKTPSKAINTKNVTKVTVKKINGKKLNLKKNYKVYIAAYCHVGNQKVILCKSITAHIVGRKNKSYSNPKVLKVKKTKYTLKKGKSAKIKAKVVLVNKHRKSLSNKHAKKFRYASTNTKIAKVTKTGKIRAKRKGTCIIYVYARNGFAKAIKVRVK